MNKIAYLRLKALRLERGWTVEQLAGLSGIHRMTIYNLEAGSWPRQHVLSKLLTTFQCMPDDLIGVRVED